MHSSWNVPHRSTHLIDTVTSTPIATTTPIAIKSSRTAATTNTHPSTAARKLPRGLA